MLCLSQISTHSLLLNQVSSFYAGTSLSCAGIQQLKTVLFHCCAAINLVGDMSNEEEDLHLIGHQELTVEVT